MSTDAADTDLTFTKHVFDHISATEEVVKKLHFLLSTDTQTFPFTRQIINELILLLTSNSKLTKDLYEENQTMLDLVRKAMSKNHPK